MLQIYFSSVYEIFIGYINFDSVNSSKLKVWVLNKSSIYSKLKKWSYKLYIWNLQYINISNVNMKCIFYSSLNITIN